MRFYVKIFFIVTIIFVFAFCFSSCKTDGENTPSQSYVYHPSGEVTSSAEETSEVQPNSFKIDTSWKKCFEVSYVYFNEQQNPDIISVLEKRSPSIFCARDTKSGDTLYYRESGSDIDSYVIVPDKKELVHSSLKGKSLDELSSTFMKLSEVDSDLPLLSNVLYMYDETVGGRACAKYIQRAYTSGSVTESVYVWIDKEFGFAAKGEVYNSASELTASWETLSFKAGGVSDEEVEIDLSDYTVKEE